LGARWKHTLKKALGNSAAEGDAGVVASDAHRVMLHVLRSLPSDAAPVRVMVAIHARHVALNAYYTRAAELAGLDTPEGLALLVVADRQSQRAERVLVTCHDLARIHAQASKRPGELPPWLQVTAADLAAVDADIAAEAAESAAVSQALPHETCSPPVIINAD
jgi:hypothetical protein